MKVMIKKWGNSATVRIPASVMKAVHLNFGQSVDVKAERGRIVIEPDRTQAFSLENLLPGITCVNLDRPIDTGPAVGREVW